MSTKAIVHYLLLCAAVQRGNWMLSLGTGMIACADAGATSRDHCGPNPESFLGISQDHNGSAAALRQRPSGVNVDYRDLIRE